MCRRMSESSFPPPEALELSVEQLHVLLRQQPEAFDLIDCREEDEWRHCRIEGATLVPLSRFAESAPLDPGSERRPAVVYCHHGMRSLRATQWLRQKGRPLTWSLAGGIDAWSAEIDPSVPRY